jgi:PD-(D/E)XK endonuclease
MLRARRGGVLSMEMEIGAGVGEININTEVGGEYGFVAPLICAMADPNGKWWKRLRGNPKRMGEVSQAAFLLKAEMMGFSLALPWGDSERYDFVVGKSGGRMLRVQVKGTGRLYRRGYEVQPVHSTRGQGKKRYTKKDIDVLVGHVQPLDVWYLIPIEEVGRAKSLRFYPGIESRDPRWERWREAWEVLR